MTTVTATVDDQTSSRTRARTRPVVSAVVTSEWTKLRSLRSTAWTLLITLLATVAVSVALCLKYVQLYPQLSADDRLGFDATAFSLSGLYLAQVALATLGVLVVTSEYSTGMIRSSLTAVPQRRTLLAGKVVVFACVAFVTAQVTVFTAFLAGQAILAREHIGVSLHDPDVLRAVVGAGAYLTLVGLFALGIGALLRSTAAALSTFFAAMFAGDVLVNFLPTTWRDALINYLPTNAGTQLFTLYPAHGALSPGAGLAVLCLYPTVVLVAAFALAGRRDP